MCEVLYFCSIVVEISILLGCGILKGHNGVKFRVQKVQKFPTSAADVVKAQQNDGNQFPTEAA